MKPVRLFTCVAIALVCLQFTAQGFARPEMEETVAAGEIVSSQGLATDEEAGPATTLEIGGETGTRHAGATTGNLDLGHSSPNPYKAMIEDLVAAPKGERRETETIPGAAPHVPKQHTLLYDEDELKSRVDSVKSTVSSMFAGDTTQPQSEEERELALQRDIAMREAYRGASLGGSGAPSSSSNSDGQRADAQDKAAKIRLTELAFLAWDLLTHPVTIALFVLYAFVRLVVAMLRVTKDPRGRRKKPRRSRSSSRSATKAASAPVVALTEFELEQERRHRDRRRRSRRHRSRRSFLDRFRSV